MIKKILNANDAFSSGELELGWAENTKVPSPFYMEFCRGEVCKSFSMSREDAKQVAMFILENL